MQNAQIILTFFSTRDKIKYVKAVSPRGIYGDTASESLLHWAFQEGKI